MPEEKVFYNASGVKVTNTRIITPSQTYAMSGITSVTAREYKPSRKLPIILGVIGLLVILAKWFLGLLIVAGAVAWWFLQKSEFTLFLSSASGENEALTSKDRTFIVDIENAVNEAIVARG